MAIIAINQGNDVSKLIELIDTVISQPKAWKEASTELKAAFETLKKAGEIEAVLSQLASEKEAIVSSKTEAEKAEAKAKASIEASKLAKAEAEKIAAENAAFAKTLKAQKLELVSKEASLLKLQEAATAEITKAKLEQEKAGAKQAELDSLIAKHKVALEAALAASV